MCGESRQSGPSGGVSVEEGADAGAYIHQGKIYIGRERLLQLNS